MINESLKITKAVSDIFTAVSSRGGKVSDFYFNCDDAGFCSISFYGCYCEDFVNSHYCVVSFKNGEPYFDIIIPLYDMKSSEVKVSFSPALTASLMSKMMDALLNLGAEIYGKKTKEHGFSMNFFAEQHILYSCLKVCGMIADENGFLACKCSVSESGDFFNEKIDFSDYYEKDSTNILLIVARFAYLFADLTALEPRKKVFFQHEHGLQNFSSAKYPVLLPLSNEKKSV
ncbi:MAG: hypothetical protein IJ727_12055 [Treponema sp.]|nr:hypothetical protein [Treponema sp.]